MLMELDHHSGVPVYRQIMEQIRHLITTGRLGAGEQVEAVRDLAHRLRVNPMTVSKAYGYLEAEGLLERRRGVGLFVARIKGDMQEVLKEQILSLGMEKAVRSAVQLGLSEAEAVEFFRKEFYEYSRRYARQR